MDGQGRGHREAAPEARARQIIDAALIIAGWIVQDRDEVNLHAGIVRVDLHTDDDLYQVQVAEILSLVPGTVVIEVVREPRRLYMHALELIDEASIDRVQRMTMAVESRVVRAFGSDAEIAAFDAACQAHPITRAPRMEE